MCAAAQIAGGANVSCMAASTGSGVCSLDRAFPERYTRSLRKKYDSYAGFAYEVSVFPSLGMNIFYVGGDFSGVSGAGVKPIDEHCGRCGKFCVTPRYEADSASKLIVFASARHGFENAYGPGYFKVESPYFLSRRWADSYANARGASQFGYLDLRHGGRAVTAALDGHAETLDEAQLSDMTRWSPLAAKAGDPTWTLK